MAIVNVKLVSGFSVNENLLEEVSVFIDVILPYKGKTECRYPAVLHSNILV